MTGPDVTAPITSLSDNYEVSKFIHDVPSDTSTSIARPPLTPEELKVDKIILFWIFTTLSDALQKWLVIVRTKLAKEAWDFISELVKDNKRDEDVGHYVIDGLPKKYNQVCGYMHYKDTFLELKTARSLLITEEMRLKSKSLALPVDSSSSSPMVLVAESGTSRNPSNPQVKSRRPCFNFAKGSYWFGSDCRYVHDHNAKSNTITTMKPSGTSTDDLLVKLLEKLGLNDNGTNKIVNNTSMENTSNTPVACTINSTLNPLCYAAQPTSYVLPTPAHLQTMSTPAHYLAPPPGFSYQLAQLPSMLAQALAPQQAQQTIQLGLPTAPNSTRVVGLVHQAQFGPPGFVPSPMANLGQATALPHTFTAGTLHDPTTGAWNMDTGDFLTRRVLLRCDNTGDLYPVTAPSHIPMNLFRYKARLVARGSTQLEGVVVDETWSDGETSLQGTDIAYFLLYVDDIVLTASSEKLLKQVFLKNKRVIPSDSRLANCWGELDLNQRRHIANEFTVHAMSTIPGFNQIQFEGFCRFIDQGLTEKLPKFPKIEDINQEIDFELFLERYQLVEPLIKERNVVYESLTYSSELNVSARLIWKNDRHSRTPVDTESKLRGDGDLVSDPTLYRSLTGSLQYLTFARPNISYAIQQVCLYMHDPREPHLSALKWILRYVSGTLDYGLQLFSSSTTDLVAYSDPTLSCSSAEAEYRGVANAVAETCWLRNLLLELHSTLSSAMLVYCDNVSAVYLSCNPVQHQRTKYIEIDIYFVRDLVVAGQVRVLHVSSRYQFADIFTKGLPSALFEEFRSSLSIRSPPVPTAEEC
ncbi:ribonuclease H-like domain-containing protein [Tanacetum coccineum]